MNQTGCDTVAIVKTKTEAADPAPVGEAPRRIAMLIYPGIAALDVAGPLQVFGFSNFLMQRQLYEIFTVGPTAEAIQTGLGFAFQPACSMHDLPLPVDTLLVSGGSGPDAVQDPEIFEWLRQTVPKSRRYGSICTGVFVLANAGLIAGKRVTTHWALGAELARRNPTATVEVDSIFVQGRQPLQLGRDFGRHRSGAGPAGGRPWPRFRTQDRPLSRAVPEALRRAGTVFNAAAGAVFIDPRHSAAAVLVPRKSRWRSARLVRWRSACR